MKSNRLTLQRFEGDKVPREAPPPSKWGQGKSGGQFVIRKVSFRNKHGKKLYRLGHKMSDTSPPLFGHQLWTLEELIKAGVKWLNKSPFGETAPAVVDEVDDKALAPADAVSDEEADEPEPVATTEFKVGDLCKHSKGNTYRILAIVDGETVRVEQVLADGKKTPGRNMAKAKLQVM